MILYQIVDCMSYSYTVKPSSIKSFLQRLKSKELEVPEKVTQKYLETIGYKTKNDRRIIPILKSIEFIDSNGVPKEKFADFRTERSAQVMADSLRKAYADLFKTYANPLEKGKGVLEDFFAKTKTTVKKGVLGLYVDTFKTLAEFADFGAEPYKETAGEEEEEIEPKGKKKLQGMPQVPEGFAINLNIQITLPVTDDAKVYENIFKALKEHIFKRD
jgi:hypothetical protein